MATLETPAGGRMRSLLGDKQCRRSAPSGATGGAGRRPPVRHFCRPTSILPPPCDTKTLPHLWGRSTGWSGFGLTGQTLNANDGQRDTNRNCHSRQASTPANGHQQHPPPKPGTAPAGGRRRDSVVSAARTMPADRHARSPAVRPAGLMQRSAAAVSSPSQAASGRRLSGGR